MACFENRIGLAHDHLLQICDNHPECILHTLQFADIETGQTSEKTVAVVETTAYQGICCQESSLIRQVLSGLPEIIHLNKPSLINIADMISKGKISIK